MNIKNIFRINKLTYLFIIISVLTASFHTLVFITILVVLHEMGHFFTALLFGLKVDRIEIYPYGGLSIIEIPLNYSIIKEMIILINGPLMQQLTYLSLIRLFYQYAPIIRIYHYAILIFNLLPIYPLDGGKLLNLIFQKIIPYKTSYKASILISYLVIILLSLVYLNNIKINSIIMIIFLIYKVSSASKKRTILYEQFLFERYKNPYNYKNSKIINSPNYFYKNNKHIIKIGDKYTLERDYLRKKYAKNIKK